MLYVHDAGRAIRGFESVLDAVRSAGEWHTALVSALNADDGFDAAQCAAMVKSVAACLRSVESGVADIATIYGGPEGTTGTGSPVELCHDQAQRWQVYVARLHQDARERLLTAVAEDLDV